jgi:predicted transcriptional regulator
MSKTSVVTARLDADLSDRLDTLAARQERSRAAVVERAVRRYVDEELTFLAFVQEGVDSADRGELIGQEEMEAWVEARGRQAAAE